MIYYKIPSAQLKASVRYRQAFEMKKILSTDIKMKHFLFVWIFCIFAHTVISYKFLGILPTASKSHYYIGHNLLKGLAEEGHDVTVMSPFQEKNPIPNYKEVFLEHSWIESRRGKNMTLQLFDLKWTCCVNPNKSKYTFFASSQIWPRIISWITIICFSGT